MKWRIFVLFLSLGGLLNNCDLPEGGPGWEPNYFGPIAKSEVLIEDVSKLEDFVFESDVSATQLDNRFQGQVDSVPAFRLNKRIGPDTFQITEVFEVVEADSLVFRISFDNAYPIDISQGTKLTFYNESNPNGDPIFSHEIQEDLEPGETFEIRRVITDQEVDNDILFYLENFGSNGSDTPVKFEQGLETVFKFELIFLKIARLEIQTGQEYSLLDTTSFNYEERSGEGSAEGELYVYFENRFPLNFKAQLYLLDDQKQLTDSLFATPLDLSSAPVIESGATGEITGDTVLVVDTVPLKDENLRSLKNASYLEGYFEVATADTSRDGTPLNNIVININNKSFLNLQVAGDVKGIANP